MNDAVVVPIGALAVTAAPGELRALGLGSCVAVVLYDPATHIAGLAHVLLPARPGPGGNAMPARYAESAVPALVEAMQEAGAEKRRLKAWLVGGATMFTNLVAPGLIAIGERNTVAARRALDALKIPVTREAVGGDFGRSVRVEAATGRVEVRTVLHGVVEF